MLRTASFLALLVWAVGCNGSGGPTGNQGTGSLRIAVSGVVGSQSGGSGSALRTDVSNATPVPFSLSANGAVDLTLPAGNYAVTYLPPPGHSVSVGPPAQVTVPANGTAILNLRVQLTVGLLGAEVLGIVAPFPPTAGSLSILRTDGSSQVPLTVTIPLSFDGYFVGVAVVPGSYSVTYSPITGYQLAPGETGVRSATVTDSPLATWVTFTVVPN